MNKVSTKRTFAAMLMCLRQLLGRYLLYADPQPSVLDHASMLLLHCGLSISDISLLRGLSEIYTSNLGFQYTIQSLLKETAENRTQEVASFAYRNDNLHDCAIADMMFGDYNITVGRSALVGFQLLLCIVE